MLYIKYVDERLSLQVAIMEEIMHPTRISVELDAAADPLFPLLPSIAIVVVIVSYNPIENWIKFDFFEWK